MSPQPPPELRPLTEIQYKVLKWISDGCPSGQFDGDYSHRVSARALAKRGFIQVSGRGMLWKASILPKGREALAKATPEPASVREPNQGDELLERVLAAGGELEVKNSSFEVREFVEESHTSPLRPHGKKLASTGSYGSPQTVTLVENWDELVEPRPVKVLEKIRRYHPSVKRFKQRKHDQRVSAEHLQPAALILQSLVEETERRDVAVAGIEDVAKRAHHFSRRKKVLGTDVILIVGGHLSHITIREIGDSGRLQLTVEDDRYRDKRDHPLEEWLPEVFRRFEVKQRDAEVRAQLEAQERVRHARRRQVAEERAREKYFEAKRWEHFKEVSHDWQKIQRHREFLEEARGSLKSLRWDQRTAVEQMLNEADAALERIDPVQNPELLEAQIKEPWPTDLGPYIPYGLKRS